MSSSVHPSTFHTSADATIYNDTCTHDENLKAALSKKVFLSDALFKQVSPSDAVPATFLERLEIHQAANTLIPESTMYNEVKLKLADTHEATVVPALNDSSRKSKKST